MSVASDHEHELDPEYLYPSDAEVVDVYESAGQLRVAVVVPCPDCGDVLQLDAAVEAITEADLELPLEDAEDQYD